MKHKCEGCRYKGEHRGKVFRPFGVCLLEPDLISAEAAFDAVTCPHKKQKKKNECKECFHYGVCKAFTIRHGKVLYEDYGYSAECCFHFKAKSNFVEPPDDDAIIFVKDNWLMLNIESKHLGEAIKRSVEYLIKNAKEREK